MTSSGSKRWLFWWLLFLLGPSAYLSLMSPVFTDEVAWKWITSRIALDGGTAISLYPQCTEVGPAKVPYLFTPIRSVESLLYGRSESIFLMRQLGVLFFLGVGILLWFYTRGVSRIRQLDAQETFVGTSAIGFLGVLPFLLTMNRPEQVLVLCLLSFAGLTFCEPKSTARKLILFAAFATLSLLFFSQHAKALFFLPFVSICLWSLRLGKKSRMFLMLFLIVCAAQCYVFFVQHTQCSNEFIKSAFSKMMISPSSILAAPKETVVRIFQNGIHVVDYLKTLLIVDVYPQEWLPTNYGFSIGAKILNGLILIFFLVWVLASAWGLLNGFRLSGRWVRPSRLGLIGLGIFVGIAGMSVFQSGKSFYDSALVIPLLAVVGVSSIDKRGIQFLGRGALVLATMSVCLVGYRFWPSLRNDWTGQSALSHQEYSVKSSYQRVIEDRALDLAAQCGIQNSSEKKHLVVDDLTYPYFIKTVEPYHAVYVLGWWGTMSIENPEEFLKKKSSAGLLSQCKWLPESLLNKAIRDHDLCCLPAF